MFNVSGIFVDSCIFVVCLFLSLALRVSGEEFVRFSTSLPYALPVFLVIKIGVFYFFRIYRTIWKFFSARDTIALVKANSLSTGLVLASTFLVGDLIRLPRSVYLIDWAVSLILLFGIRLIARLLSESKQTRSINKTGIPTLIYGAGQNGKVLAQRFSIDVSLNCHIMGFIDDDDAKVGNFVLGLKVLGTRKDLEQAIGVLKIRQLVIAIPNLSGDAMREIITICGRHSIRPRIVSKFTTGDEATRRAVEIARSVELSDLLNRPHKEISSEPIRKHFQGKRVLVTGAGGSIGSELARQIYGFDPAKLILLDHSEYNLFQIDQELRALSSSSAIVPVLANITDQEILKQVFDSHEPEVVIHAAAYKHVHLVEASPYSAIINNVLGTRNLLQLSSEFDGSNFLLISSDKAVNPVGVMGSTKRVCELMVTAYALATRKNYCSVRFGNVLGSSGSLIPILQKQIAEGGPVTVTHPDMTRFFMLIPEAVSLVLTGCTLSKPGDINVLKMGDPVKIVDIAKNLIVLSGKTEEEVSITFIGPRPGEKLYEELYIRGDELRTEHPDILTLPLGDHALENILRDVSSFWTTIDNLIQFSQESDSTALDILRQLVSNQIILSPQIAAELQSKSLS